MSLEDVVKLANKDSEANRIVKDDGKGDKEQKEQAQGQKKRTQTKIKQGDEERELRDIPGLKTRIRRMDLTATEKDILIIFLADKHKKDRLSEDEKDLFLVLLRIESAHGRLDKLTNPIYAELEGEKAELRCIAKVDGFSPGMKIKKGIKARANYLPELDRVDVFYTYEVPGRAQLSERSAYKVAMGIPLTDEEIPESKQVARAIRMRKKEFDMIFEVTGASNEKEIRTAEEALFS